MNSLFHPRLSSWQTIGEKLNDGHHLGKDGALNRAKQDVLPLAKTGDVPAMMLMANVYYTVAGAIGPSGNIITKIRAGIFLWEARQWATNAFLADTQLPDLILALEAVDRRLRRGNTSGLEPGHVHVLMSCYVQWGKQFKGRLHISDTHERRIAKRCNTVIEYNGTEQLKALAALSMLELFTESEEREWPKECLEKFYNKHYDELISKGDISKVDIGLVQTMCRVARVMKRNGESADLARKYGLVDQANKYKHY